MAVNNAADPHVDPEHPNLLLPANLLSPTPSEVRGLSKENERLYRNWGCELTAECGILLKLPQAVIATAQTLLHRFYFRRAMQQFDCHTVAMACLFLAGKVEEEPRRLRDILNVFYHSKLRRQHKLPKVLTLGGLLYAKWKAEILRTERFILKELGFSMYNITEHPHKYVLTYIKVLGGSQEFAQRAWSVLNDSLRLDLCVRFYAENIACAAIYLAARSLLIPLPPLPWYEVFNTSKERMLGIAEEILHLYLLPKALWLPSLREDATPDADDGEGPPLDAAASPEELWGDIRVIDEAPVPTPMPEVAPHVAASRAQASTSFGETKPRTNDERRHGAEPPAFRRRSRSPEHRYGRGDARDASGRARDSRARSRSGSPPNRRQHRRSSSRERQRRHDRSPGGRWGRDRR